MAEAGRLISDPRIFAVRCLVMAERHRLLVPEAVQRFSHQMEARDLAFAHEIMYGTFRFLPGLEQVLRKFCRKPKFPPEVHWLLLASFYELGFMRSADYAVIDQANRNVVKLGFPRLKSLVNAVLRNAQRAGSELWADHDSVAWLLPPWLEQLFLEQQGQNRLRSWVARWADRGCISYWHKTGQPPAADDPVSPVLPHTWRREAALPEAWLQSGVYIQNESSQWISRLAVTLAPERALDMCAAPGGKSCYLAAFSPKTQLLACDMDAHRLGLIRQNQQRLGLQFELRTADATQLECDAEFDLVMLDAPCSGIGILGRHPEIKRHKTGPADNAMRKTQAQLLEAAWRYVKPGGYILYSVCSLDRREVPEPPDGALLDQDQLREMVPEGLPVLWEERGLLIEPGPVFDGFRAMLLHKPNS